jgi:hypothetical protein
MAVVGVVCWVEEVVGDGEVDTEADGLADEDGAPPAAAGEW